MRSVQIVTQAPPAGTGAEEPPDLDEAFERHAPALLRYAMARVGREAAKDVVAEAFARAFRDRHRFDPTRGTLVGWLYGFVVNALREQRRLDERDLRIRARLVPPHAEASPPAPDGGAFLAAVGRLEPDDRELILLLAWAELSYEEIAQATGRTLPSVRARLHRLREQLRRELAPSLPEGVLDA